MPRPSTSRLVNTSALRSSDQIHHALRPPCHPGRAPGKNLLMCEQCGVGQYSNGSSCQGCPPGSVPSEDRSTCRDCQGLQYSVGGDSSLVCDLPLILVDNDCVWWDEGPATVATYTEKLVSLGLQKAQIQQKFCEMRALQSDFEPA